MNAWIFALYMTLSFNIPIPFSLAVYDEALNLEWIEAHEIASVLVAEHANRGEFPTHKTSSAGARGVGQVMHSVRVGYNEHSGSSYVSADSLFDWKVNIKVLSWELNRIKRVHATKARCRGTDHHWHAHYVCGWNNRETCNTRWRERLTVKAERWRGYRVDLDASLSGLLSVLSGGLSVRIAQD
jgi:hypothetical protein